jgi:hypothetical protein
VPQVIHGLIGCPEAPVVLSAGVSRFDLSSLNVAKFCSKSRLQFSREEYVARKFFSV